MIRLLYIVSHPIQYQAPLLRRISQEQDMELDVLFEDARAAGTYRDKGFGRDVSWDVPLTDGYRWAEYSGDDDLRRRIAAADVVWVHGWSSNIRRRALSTAGSVGTPVLMRGENNDVSMPDGHGLRGWLKRRYLKWIFRRCAAFLTIGSDNRDYYLARGIADDRVFLVPYAVDNGFFQARAAAASAGRAAFRRELGLPDEGPVILYAGKFSARKHPLELIAAFKRLPATEGPAPQLLMVGDGELRGAVDDAASDNPNIHVLGFRNQSELPAFYGLADIFVLASAREPWGLAVNEAMNAGCAVIVSDECGSARDLVDNTCGAIVGPGNVDALVVALERLLANRADLEGKGEAARKRVSAWDFEADVEGLRQAVSWVTQGRSSS